MEDTKAQLRQQLRAARREALQQQTEQAVAQRSRRLSELVMADPSVLAACNSGGAITAFASLPTEPPTALLLANLIERGATVLLPIIGSHRSLSWAKYEGATHLHPAVMNIPEPDGHVVAGNAAELMAAGVTVLLLPALAVDESGARLGQGGGYYDILLAQLPALDQGGPVRIALVGPNEVLPVNSIPMAPHDQRIDRVIVA